MSDGSVRIEVLTDDKQVSDLIKRLNGLDKEVSGIGSSAEGIASPLEKADGAAKNFTASLLLAKAAAMAIQTTMQAINGAIGRFDTLNQYPKVMEKLGYSTDQSERSIRKLSNGIEGLPTTLQEVVGTTQRIASLTGDLNKATDTTLALNNAFLASGASAGDASRGLTQYTQMLSTGRVDIMSWRTLQETMTVALNQTAAAFGYTGSSAQNDLYAALKSGEVTFTQFNDKIIELDKGVGGFADTALTSSQGISTSWTNIRTAVTKGVTVVIQALDELSKEVTGRSIAENFNDLKFIIGDAFNFIGDAIGFVTPLVKVFAIVLTELLGVAEDLDFVLVGLATAIVAFKVYNDVFKPFTASMNLAVVEAISMTTAVSTAGVVADGTAKSTGLLTIAYGVLTSQLTLAQAKQLLLTKATLAFKAITNPVGLAIGVVTAAAALLFKRITGVTEEVNNLVESMEETRKEAQSLRDSIVEGSESYQTQKKAIKDQSAEYRDLAYEIELLTKKEKLSNTEKKKLTENISDLNGSVSGLNLLYDEQTGKVNLTSQAIAKYIEAQEGANQVEASKVRIVELEQQRLEVAENLEKIFGELSETELKKMETDGIQIFQMGKLNEQYEAHQEEVDKMAEYYTALGIAVELEEQAQQAAFTATAEAEAAAVAQRKFSMADLTETQRATADALKSEYQRIQDANTNMFSKIESNAEVTTEQMLENLLYNQQAISEWADNLAALADKGINQGLLDKLREMGPEGAGYVKQLNDLSADELENFNVPYSEAAEKSADALSKVYDIAAEDMPKELQDYIASTEQSLKSQIESTDFESIGKAIPDGVVAGINSGTKDAETTSVTLAKAISSGTARTLDIHSPSGVFKGYGVNIVDGLALGIISSSSRATMAVNQMVLQIQFIMNRSLATINTGTSTSFTSFVLVITRQLTAAVSVFRSRMNDMANIARESTSQTIGYLNRGASGSYSAGYQMGIGFRNGLASTRYSILATAQSIANQAARKIKTSLQIHSPSRVTEKLGVQFGAGFSGGIASEIPKVKRLSLELAESALPQVDLPRSISFGGVSTSSVSNTTTDNRQTTTSHVFNIAKVVWNGKDDIEKTMQEMGWIAGKQDWSLDYGMV